MMDLIKDPRGTGKSKVLENLIKAVIKAGYTITYKDKQP
jgi:hypothetical protein